VLYDDDDFNGDDGGVKDGDNGELVTSLSPTYSLMQASDNPALNVFAPAYIMPQCDVLVCDGGGDSANNGSISPFVLNLNSSDLITVTNRIGSGRNSGAA
jgi:hypothetical protein